ncbi:MAG: Uncharacterized protein H6Q66_1987 [Firmicutes bacterium]|nr:Uncharacterized protein [Bacillota bacterium]
MPARWFICPDGSIHEISACIENCRMGSRCLFLPTLRAIANSENRQIEGFTITELIAGTRETYLKKTVEYAAAPQDRMLALNGSEVHAKFEQNAEDLLSEVRLREEDISGMFDLYGDVLGDGMLTLGDYKVTSSYKGMLALGKYAVEVETKEIFKSGIRKGQPKTRKEWQEDGVRKGIQDWRLQLNGYRVLLEQAGYPVERMIIQMMIRDAGLEVAARRNVDQSVYLLPINRISDQWVKRYFNTKAQRLRDALSEQKLPPICSAKERWQDRKCQRYCDVAGACSHALTLGSKNNTEVA